MEISAEFFKELADASGKKVGVQIKVRREELEAGINPLWLLADRGVPVKDGSVLFGKVEVIPDPCSYCTTYRWTYTPERPFRAEPYIEEPYRPTREVDLD